MAFDPTGHLTLRERLNDPVLVKIRRDNALKIAADEYIALQREEVSAQMLLDVERQERIAQNHRTDAAEDALHAVRAAKFEAERKLSALNEEETENVT